MESTSTLGCPISKLSQLFSSIVLPRCGYIMDPWTGIRFLFQGWRGKLLSPLFMAYQSWSWNGRIYRLHKWTHVENNLWLNKENDIRIPVFDQTLFIWLWLELFSHWRKFHRIGTWLASLCTYNPCNPLTPKGTFMGNSCLRALKNRCFRIYRWRCSLRSHASAACFKNCGFSAKWVSCSTDHWEIPPCHSVDWKLRFYQCNSKGGLSSRCYSPLVAHASYFERIFWMSANFEWQIWLAPTTFPVRELL